jgi:hypothetical protein
VRNDPKGASRRRILGLLAVAAGITAAVPGLAAAGSGGVTGRAFYVDGDLYRTVATPTDFSNASAPDASFDTIFDFGGLQPNVAEAGPGQPGFRGGRWQVRPMSFNSSYAATVSAHDANGRADLESNEEVEAALADSGSGGATAVAVVRSFECPVIKQPASAG